ncbi:MAG: hypothetical protein AAGF97_08410, partial [Planctomycetota bacterium]
GRYRPDGDHVLSKVPNHQEPLTITFDRPVSQVGSFIGTGRGGNRPTVTIQAFGADGKLIKTLSGHVDDFADLANREGFWGIRTRTNVITKITIRNDNPTSYGNALIVDDLTWHRGEDYSGDWASATQAFEANFSDEPRLVELDVSAAIVEEGFPTRWEAADYSPSISSPGGTAVAAEGEFEVGALDGYDGTIAADASFVLTSQLEANSSGMQIHLDQPVSKIGGLSAIGGLPETSFVYSRLRVIGTDEVGNQVAVETLALDPHADLENQEVYWTLESSHGDISNVTIQLVDQEGHPVGMSYTASLDRLRFVPVTTTTCDLDQDGSCGVADLDQLISAIASGDASPRFDLTSDGLVDVQDRDAWLAEAGAQNLASGASYQLADANLDGLVDGLDFVTWNNHKFSVTGKWSQGDFNADGMTDGLDFVIWNSNKFMTAALQDVTSGLPTQDDQDDTVSLVDELFANFELIDRSA